jgi:sugar phosphate isomerase/epimerase
MKMAEAVMNPVNGGFGGKAAAVIAASRTSEPGPLGVPMGIQLYTVNAEMMQDAAGTLEQIAAMGYTEVETAGYGSLKTAAEFRKVLDEVGLKCPSAHLEFNLANLEAAFDDAHVLGCMYATISVPRMLLMEPMKDPYAMTSEDFMALVAHIMRPMEAEEFKQTATALNEAGAAAQRAGLKFAAHNHHIEFAEMEGGTGFDYLMEHTDPELVKFELDCGWARVCGHQPGEIAERHPGRIKLLHMRDFMPYEGVSKPGFGNVSGAELGRGVVNQKEVLKQMEGRGIEHVFVEQEGPFSRMSALEAAKTNYEFLRSLARQRRP